MLCMLDKNDIDLYMKGGGHFDSGREEPHACVRKRYRADLEFRFSRQK